MLKPNAHLVLAEGAQMITCEAFNIPTLYVPFGKSSNIYNN